MKIQDMSNALIIGGGTMGLRIGLQSAISGFQTAIFDQSESAIKKGKATTTTLLDRLISKQRLKAEDRSQILERITWTSDLESAAQNADFVSESITEDLLAKIELWSHLSKLTPGSAVLTTNTSYLLPSQIADVVDQPERFCAFHFHDVFWANVVDIMPHPGTAAWMIDLLLALGKLLHQTPVVLKSEHSGYIFNHMLIAFLGAAGDLRTKEISTIEDIDRSWMGNFKMAIGPFGILDEVGLDTAWHIIKVRQDSKSQRFATLLKSYLDRGHLGVKTGQGFYSYPNPSFKSPDFVTATPKS